MRLPGHLCPVPGGEAPALGLALEESCPPVAEGGEGREGGPPSPWAWAWACRHGGARRLPLPQLPAQMTLCPAPSPRLSWSLRRPSSPMPAPLNISGCSYTTACHFSGRELLGATRGPCRLGAPVGSRCTRAPVQGALPRGFASSCKLPGLSSPRTLPVHRGEERAKPAEGRTAPGAVLLARVTGSAPPGVGRGLTHWIPPAAVQSKVPFCAGLSRSQGVGERQTVPESSICGSPRGGAAPCCTGPPGAPWSPVEPVSLGGSGPSGPGLGTQGPA